jgi:hypothetical protein
MLPLGEFTVNKRRRDMGVRAASFEVMRKIRANAGLLRMSPVPIHTIGPIDA